MAVIRVPCDSCLRTTRIEVVAAVLVVGPARQPVCAFTCGLCGHVGVHDVTADDVLRLAAAGCPVSERVVEVHEGRAPTLTYDDLIDLHRLLESDGWFHHLEDSLTSTMHPSEERRNDDTDDRSSDGHGEARVGR